MDSAIVRFCVFGMLLLPLPASASGIFVPADAGVAISQAGERVLFGQQGSSLLAHIQVYYRSQPTDFVWLLPVPGVPTLEPGNGELFSRLTAATQPAYQVDRFYRCADDTQPILGSAVQVPSPDLPVAAGTLSPYESAILPADSPDAVLKWLLDRKYPVPPNLSAGLGPYCGRGGSIVALRFQATETAGALEPIVLHYKSDGQSGGQSDQLSLPFLVGSRGTTAKTPLQVWILGPSRAVPLGAANAVLNDAQINWFTGGRNYQEVLAGAIAENGDRAFVTEYAGPSAIAQDALRGAVDVSRYPYLTRLSTVLPPADLTSDPVFSYNPSLSAVAAVAKATMTYHCPVSPSRCVGRGYAGSAGYGGAGYYDCGYYNTTGIYVAVDGYSGVDYGDGYGGMRALWDYGGGYGAGDYGGYSGGGYGGGGHEGGYGGGYGGSYGGSAGVIGHLSRSLSTYYPWTVLLTTQGFRVAYTAQAADQGQFFSPTMPYSLRTELLTRVGPSLLMGDNTAAIQTALGMGPHAPPAQPVCRSAFGCSAAADGGASEGNHAKGLTILLSGLLLLLWHARTARAKSRCRNAG